MALFDDIVKTKKDYNNVHIIIHQVKIKKIPIPACSSDSLSQ